LPLLIGEAQTCALYHPAVESVMTDKTDPPATSRFNRRSFIAGAAGTAVAPLIARAAAPVTDLAPVQDLSLPVNVTLRVNGDSKSLKIDARTTALELYASTSVSLALRKVATTVNAAPARY
jgi:hypothetical protein